jgi:cysteinyl-tRNA synthetase
MAEPDYKRKYFDLLEKHNLLLEEKIIEYNSDIESIKDRLSGIVRLLEKAESVSIINTSTNKVNSDFIQTLIVKMKLMDEQEAFEMASRIRNEIHSQWIKPKEGDSNGGNLDPHPSTTR